MFAQFLVLDFFSCLSLSFLQVSCNFFPAPDVCYNPLNIWTVEIFCDFFWFRSIRIFFFNLKIRVILLMSG